MLSHEYFHEQAHIEMRHEAKRMLFLFATAFIAFLVYRFFCHKQEFEADRLAAQKCGKAAAIESLRFLRMREKPQRFLSLHPKTEKRINAVSAN